MIFCLIVPLADGIHSVAGGQEYADSSDIAPADSSAEIPDEKRYLGNYEVTADEDGNVYIDGMLVNDGDIIDGRVRISVKDVDDEENAEGCDEPFTLNIPFVDTETVVTFLPTDEGLEAQRQILYDTDDMTRDSDTPVLPDDGRVELTIQIAPGKKEQPEVPLKFGLEVRNGMYADLLVWDSELQEFSDMLRVYDVIPESEKSVALTLLIPPELSERLKGTIGSSQTFKIVSWMEDAPDAKVEVTDLMVVDLPERLTDQQKSEETQREDWYTTAKKDFLNTKLGATMFKSSHTKISDEGATADIDACFNICILGKSFGFLKVDGFAKGSGPTDLPARDCQDSSIKHLGKTVWSMFKPGDKKTSFSGSAGVTIWVTILIVPVELSAWVQGEIGIQVQYNTSINKFYYRAGPFIDTAAYASASVSMIIAKAGIKGGVEPVIKDEFWGEVSCSMELRNGGRDLWGGVSFRVWNDFYGPHGKIGPFVVYPRPGICKKEVCGAEWLAEFIHVISFGLFGDDEICIDIPYPCVREVEKWWVIADWGGYHRTDTLIDLSESVTIRLPVPVPTSLPSL